MDEATEVTDEVEGLVGPVVPGVWVVRDARWFVVLESEAVNGPFDRCPVTGCSPLADLG